MKVYVGPATRLQGKVRVPPSKNYTSRYIWVSALTEGESVVVSPATNDDAKALLSCCRRLGAEFWWEEKQLRIKGFGAKPCAPGVLDPGNGGLVLRLLLPVGLLLPEVKYTTSYPASLGKRPQGDLLTVLRRLGAEVEDVDGHLPITIRGGRPLRQRAVTVSGRVSSQFATALLLIAPLLGGLSVQVTDGLVSRPPLATTLAVMAEAGVTPEADWSQLTFTVPAGGYRPGVYRVPGDYPAAAAMLAAAAIVPSAVTLYPLDPLDQQGEKQIIPYLQQLGVTVERAGAEVTVRGGAPLTACAFNGEEAIDAVLSMAAVASLAEGTTTFSRVANLRWKESDRIGDLARSLRQIGVAITETADGFIIKGNPRGYEGGIELDACQDHRLVMAFAVLALRTEKGIIINGAEHVSKSYPGFFTDLAALGARVEEITA
ncbi:MAG: 3-phosphoshikimate 1-carboxyvinyltransferase [Firmicutes bacterium]|nr:3-phosphoshikimate 1-carboxyvinyltransferase [Bacillota bacterium]